MKIKFLLTVCTLLLITVPAQPVEAHVLLVDEKTNIAAVFHSNPDDDPIAGEPTQLYFDIQDKNSEVRIPYSGYELTVTDQQGTQITLTTKAAGSTVSAEYTFPARGLYKLNLKSQEAYNAFQAVSLDGSLRVNRGSGSVPAQNKYEWAVLGSILCGAAIAALLIVVVNNRKQIRLQSKF